MVLKYTYDGNGRLLSRWSAAKGTTYYTNDAVGNLTKINYPTSTDVTFGYDALNRPTSMVDAAGTTAYAYTSGGQLWTEDGPFASDTVTNIYSSRLRMDLILVQPTGTWTNHFTYDSAARLATVTSPAGSFTYSYAAGLGSLLPIKIALPNTSYITNTYDNVARLTWTSLRNSSHTDLDYAKYGYNAGNQRTAFTNAAGTYYLYTYDNIGQVTVGDSSVAGEDRGYYYDAAWNLNRRTNNGTVSTFICDNKNEVTNALGGTFTYDANGNPTYFNISGSKSYSYDDENRLTSVSMVNTWRSDFVYDGLGRMRTRLDYTWNGSTWVLSTTTYYIYDGMRVIQERNSGNTPTVAYTRGADLSGSFEGAGGIGGLLARSHGYSSGNWSTHNCYHADGNGNVTYLVDSSQALAASYRYDPFGNTISSSGTLSNANVYRFSSKEVHVNSGMYYYLFRFYDPNLQRWINRDPLAEPGFESLRRGHTSPTQPPANLYIFVQSDPVGRTDPDGLKACSFTICFPIPCPPHVGLGFCAALCASRHKGIPIGPPLCLICFSEDQGVFEWYGCPCSKNLIPW